jgi:hypothetical protein
LEDRFDFLGGQMFRFHVWLLELMHSDKADLGQAARNVIASRPPGFVFVKHDDHLAVPVGMLAALTALKSINDDFGID